MAALAVSLGVWGRGRVTGAFVFSTISGEVRWGREEGLEGLAACSGKERGMSFLYSARNAVTTQGWLNANQRGGSVTSQCERGKMGSNA